MVRTRSAEASLRADSRVAAALFRNTQRAVLGLLFCHSDQAFYLSEIIRAAGTGAGAVQRELDRLLDAGLVTRSRRGKQVFYQANRETPVFPALRDLMVKTAGVADVLREALAPLSECIRVAIAYTAALSVASAALAAAGYRVEHEAHHYRLIQSLEVTLGASAGVIRQFEAFRKKRNVASYERAGEVSEGEAEEMVRLAQHLRRESCAERGVGRGGSYRHSASMGTA